MENPPATLYYKILLTVSLKFQRSLNIFPSPSLEVKALNSNQNMDKISF